MNAGAVRRFALSLPDATEEPHFHYTSFRIGGRIFATMPPGDDLLHVFVPDEDREAATAAYPDICAALHWGKRVVGVRVDLAKASARLVEDLLRAAYDGKAQQRKR
jgi:predicted DNA-binding protein (MmcQ/YjbR family)